MAGASKELGEAVYYQSFPLGEIAQALEQALELPVQEQIQRNLIIEGGCNATM
jgi:trehalose-6-phosphate synthase